MCSSPSPLIRYQSRAVGFCKNTFITLNVSSSVALLFNRIVRRWCMSTCFETDPRLSLALENIRLLKTGEQTWKISRYRQRCTQSDCTACEGESEFGREGEGRSINWWLQSVPNPGGHLHYNSVLNSITPRLIPLNPCKVRAFFH